MLEREAHGPFGLQRCEWILRNGRGLKLVWWEG